MSSQNQNKASQQQQIQIKSPAGSRRSNRVALRSPDSTKMKSTPTILRVMKTPSIAAALEGGAGTSGPSMTPAPRAGVFRAVKKLSCR